MKILNELAKHFGPGGLSGCSLRQWLKVLRENSYSVDARYWPRAVVTTFNSVGNSFWHWREKRFHDEIENTPVPDPLFVLGIWRSGTTHLHNLLVQDDRFAAPNLYQVMYPHTFLSTESFLAPFAGMFAGETRPMDNVRFSISDDPQEDEFSLSPDGHTFMNQCAFPRTGCHHYRRLLTFEGASPEDIELWKRKLLWFYRKLTLKYARPLVLKSPAHTGRIKTLLEMFPNAMFVHIHRDPHRVVQSTLFMMEQAFAFWCFQKPNITIEQVISDYGEIYDAFFEQRELIPSGNFCEIAYDDLVADPMTTLRDVYEQLSLPEFEHAESSLETYLASIANYKTNHLRPPHEEVRRKLVERAPRAFAEYGYAE